jgi:hypothetical protein
MKSRPIIDKKKIIDPRTKAKLEDSDSLSIHYQPTLNSTKFIDNHIKQISISKFDPIEAVQNCQNSKVVYSVATKESLDLDVDKRLYKELVKPEDFQMSTPRAKVSISKEYLEQKLLKPQLETWYAFLNR